MYVARTRRRSRQFAGAGNSYFDPEAFVCLLVCVGTSGRLRWSQRPDPLFLLPPPIKKTNQKVGSASPSL